MIVILQSQERPATIASAYHASGNVRYRTQELKFRVLVIWLRWGLPLNAEKMRRNAEHCLDLASKTADETLRMRYLRAANTWKTVATNKERLDAALMVDEPAVETSAEKVA